MGNRFASSQAYPVILVRTPGSKPVPQYHRIANSIMSGCHSFKVSGFFCILKKPPELGVNNVPNSWAVKFHWILVDVFFWGILITGLWNNPCNTWVAGVIPHINHSTNRVKGSTCSARKLGWWRNLLGKNRVCIMNVSLKPSWKKGWENQSHDFWKLITTYYHYSHFKLMFQATQKVTPLQTLLRGSIIFFKDFPLQRILS